MNSIVYFTLAVLAVCAQSSIAFKLGGSSLQEKFAVPVVTESESSVHVQLGEREPKVIILSNSLHTDDCEAFSYPGNGADYQDNEDVVFLINSETREPRELVFTAFDVESYYDSVTVFVWVDNQFQQVGQYSGNTAPSAIVAPEGRFLISFKTDTSFVRKGFTFVLRNPHAQTQAKKTQETAVEDLSIPIVAQTETGINVKIGNRKPVVVANIEEDCGEFSYPANGENYQNHEDVVFLISTQTRGPREFALPTFQTENGYDFVSVFVWENNQFNLVGRYAGVNTPPTFIAPEGRVLISFTSDYSYTYSGFSVVWYNPASPLQA